MRVQDASKRSWTVVRRWTPWRRVIQPLATAIFEYLPFRAREHARQPGTRERAKQRREARRTLRQAKREQTTFSGWSWLLLPFAIIALLAVGIGAQIVEILQAAVHIAIWLVLLPFAIVEVLIRAIAGLGLLLVRAVGLARSRVDVLAYHGNGSRIASLTVLLVPGWGNAGRLAAALAEQRRLGSAPFDPTADPAVAGLPNAHRAEVVRHETAWPSNTT